MTSSFMSKFRAEMEKLGGHPDKNIITTLTVSADRHRHRAVEIVDLIARAALSSRTPPANRSPLCYLMDSILKNVGEPYIGLFGTHVAAMACRTYEHGAVRDRQCVLKLLRTWRERALFPHATLSSIDSFVDRLEKGSYSAHDRRPDERRTPPLPAPPHEPLPPHDPLPPHEPLYGGGGGGSMHKPGMDGRRDGRDRRNRDGGRERRERRDGRERERDFYPTELPPAGPPRLPPVQLPTRASQSRSSEKDRRPPPPPPSGLPMPPGPSVYDPPSSSVYDPPPLEPEVGDKRRQNYTGGGGTDPRQAKRPHPSSYPSRDGPRPPVPPLPPPPRHDPYRPPEPIPQTAPPRPPPPPPMPSQPPLPTTPPPPPPVFTLPPVAKDIHFVLAVEKEMRSMLEAMVTELGEKPMSIEELAKRSPQTAEDFKKAAEAAVAYRIQMAAVEAEKAKGPFQESLSGPTDYDAAREVVNRIKRRLLELHADPTAVANTRPGLLSAAAQSAAQLEAMIQTMEASAQLLATPKPAALSAADQLMTKAALQAFAQQMVLQQQQQQQLQQRQQQQQQAPQPVTPSGAQQLLSSLLGLVPAAPAAQPESSSGLSAFTSEGVSKKIPWVIHALHQGDQCPEDGRRFKSKAELQEHLDWHFRKNEEARETGGKKDKAYKSRQWLLTVTAWVAQPPPSKLLLTSGEKAKTITSSSEGKGNGISTSQQPQVQAVPADASYPNCRLCGEPFSQFWDESAQMFMYSSAVKVLVAEGRLLRVEPGMEIPPGAKLIPVHQLCFQAAPSHEAAELLLTRRSSSIGAAPMVEG